MGSSSRKTSSRKKSSKLSSQSRKLKKCSRKTKYKKRGRRHDSISSHPISSHGNDSYSSNSDDDSISSASVSTSSSEGTYRRRKNLSRSRGNLKTRKRARKRSSSRESSGELAQVKKRKRSKKDSDSKARKTKSRRKKPRRDVSISLASSESRGCSTCKGGSNTDSEESKCERVWGKDSEKKKDEQTLHKDKRGTKMSIRRSRSHSSYSRSRDQSGSVSPSEEKFPSEYNPRRLRSVITFAERTSEGEGNKWEKDLQNEEIVYDHDDCPSKSSSGGGSKKELTRSPIAFEGEKRTESCKFVSDNEVTEPSESVNDAHEQYVRDPFLNEVETHISAKESRNTIPLADADSGADDLEAILRQKALQNLKKFQRGHKKNINPTSDKKNKDDGDVNPSSTSNAEIVQSSLRKKATLTEVERDDSDGGQAGKVSGIAKRNANHPPDGLALSRNLEKEGHNTANPVVGKSVIGNSSFRGRFSGLDTLNHTTTSGASLDKDLSETERSERKTTISVTRNLSLQGRSSGLDTLNKTAKSVTSPDKNLMETERSDDKTQSMSPIIGINKGTASSSSTIDPAICAASGGQSLNNQKDEVKDDAQYQQKTMSVMRGGEMVKVNYKVYIPQRAAALARRQLKR
ncbi:hypothetical protein ACH5RR_037641 [Cinchona calisaya]|uniref:Uncharacterized protein n=1 Tax=Cinchona calisaya TaxID=153742 RepID=A0ABD2YBG5_9GENT